MLNPLEYEALKKEALRKTTPASRKVEIAGMDVRLARVVARHKGTPLEVLEALAGERDLQTLTGVAGNPNATGTLLERLSQDGRLQVKARVALHPNTPAQVLEALARHSKAQVRSAVVWGAQTPLQVLGGLLLDGDEDVRQSVLRRLSRAEQEGLLKEGNPRVREVLALHVPFHVLQGDLLPVLMNDPEERVRGALALRHDLPERTLELFRNDPSPFVQCCHAANPQTPLLEAQRVFERAGEEEKLLFGNRTDFTPQMLEVLIQHPDGKVRAKLALWPWTPLKCLRVLACDGDVQVLDAVLEQPNTPGDVLEKLVNHPHMGGRMGVWARHPNTPYEVVERWIQVTGGHELTWYPQTMPLERVLEFAEKRNWTKLQHPSMPHDVLREAALQPHNHPTLVNNPNLPEDLIRMLWDSPHVDRPQLQLADIPNLPLDLQLKLCQNPDWYTRHVFAKSPHLHLETMKVLAQDTHSWVRSALLNNPRLPLEVLEVFLESEDESERKRAGQVRVLWSLYQSDQQGWGVERTVHPDFW